MRLLTFTAGAGGMYCGSCIRDNALARELGRRGHRLRLVPLYQNARSDEESVAESRVRLGGVPLYLQHAAPLLGKIRWLDPLLESSALVRLAGRLSSSTDPAKLGPLTITTLLGERGPARRAVRALCDSLAGEEFDLVVLPNSLLLGLAAPLARALGAPVGVTFSGEDLFLSRLPENHREAALALMREAARSVTRFFGVTEYHARDLAGRLGVSADRVSVVRLGVDPAGYPDAEPEAPAHAGAVAGRPVRIGFFSRVAPEKGLDRLAKAVAVLAGEETAPPLRLAAAGWMSPAQRGYLESVRRRLAEEAPGVEFEYRGELDRAGKIAFLAEADLIAIPAAFPEPKGLAAIEAMMAGTPVVVPREGAYPALLDRTEGGALARSTSPGDFAAALGQLALHPERRRSVGARARRRAREEHSLARMADDAEAAYALAAASPRAA